MTREEAIKKLAEIIFDVSELGDIPYDTEDEQCAMNIARRRIDELFPQLPDNLGEAAEKYVDSMGLKGFDRVRTISDFKAGAEWMARKGEKAKWKPSEEQIEALKTLVTEGGLSYHQLSQLQSLCNDLIKNYNTNE